MKNLTLSASTIAAALLTFGLAPPPAIAGPASAWVSNKGADVPTCGAVSAPCRTFQYVHDSILGAAGGEIDILTPGDYGRLVIGKPLSIVNDGVGTAGVLQVAAGFDAIAIFTPGAVLLEGLTIEGGGIANNGVNVVEVGSLTITKCTIRGFAGKYPNGNGVFIEPSSGTVSFGISNSSLTGNTHYGLWIDPEAGGPSSANVVGTLTRVEASGNKVGVEADGFGSGKIIVIANQVDASENFVGFSVNNASVYLTRSMATGDIYGVYNFGGALSYGDNAINGNTGLDVNGGLQHAALQ
jgi:hypothetical protein